MDLCNLNSINFPVCPLLNKFSNTKRLTNRILFSEKSINSSVMYVFSKNAHYLASEKEIYFGFWRAWYILYLTLSWTTSNLKKCTFCWHTLSFFPMLKIDCLLVYNIHIYVHTYMSLYKSSLYARYQAVLVLFYMKLEYVSMRCSRRHYLLFNGCCGHNWYLSSNRTKFPARKRIPYAPIETFELIYLQTSWNYQTNIK